MSCRAQLLKAGTSTKAHRSTSSTVYFVIRGDGSSVINGREYRWGRGDVFVVPTWAWHEHRCAGKDAFLFSITDQPVLKILGMFREEAYEPDDGHQQITSTFNS